MNNTWPADLRSTLSAVAQSAAHLCEADSGTDAIIDSADSPFWAMAAFVVSCKGGAGFPLDALIDKEL